MKTQEALTALLQQIEELKRGLLSDGSARKLSENRLLKFNEKEIIQMPKTFRKEFRADGCTAHVRKRADGRYKCSYEIRYTRNGYNISASATTLEEAKKRFIEKLNTATPKSKDDTLTVPTNFDAFAMYWFENFHKRKVAAPTYKKNLDTYKRDIQPALAKAKLSDISPLQIQRLLERFDDKGRTKETLHGILNQIFACAVKHGIARLNPLGMVFYQKHEREHGKALSKADEKRLLGAYAGTSYQIDFAIALYTGLRPNEYPTATIDGGFIKARNSKRKDGKIEYKRIPISPMLRPYLVGVFELKLHRACPVTKRLKKVLPTHTLKDIRKTFQTRCTECGIADVAIGMFMGNGIGSELKKTYTEVSDEWLLEEGEKLKY